MSYADDIRRIANQGSPKGALDATAGKSPIDGDSKALINNENNPTSSITPPLTLEILTYDATKDVTFADVNGVNYTLKTAETAKIIDANGREFPIDTITYA